MKQKGEKGEKGEGEKVKKGSLENRGSWQSGEKVKKVKKGEQVKKVCEKAQPRKIDGKSILVVNASHWMSEIGAKLSPECDFATIWYYDHESKRTRVSLRSFHDTIDVSEIAKDFSGGGHKIFFGDGGYTPIA